MTDSNSIHCAIGEYAVLAELLRQGFDAYLAHGPSQKEWDIMVMSNPNIKRIQVKTISWLEKSAVNGNFESLNYDYLIIVLLNKDKDNTISKPMIYLILSKSEAMEICSKRNNKRKDGKQTITVSKNFRDKSEILEQAEGAWRKLIIT